MVAFQGAVVGWVRQAAHPQPVLVSSGHAVPRPAAHHLALSYHAAQRDWTKDTEAELQAVLELCHSGLDLISVHIYPTPDNYRFGKGPEYLLGIAAKAAAAGPGKVVYLGEFGLPLFNFQNWSHTAGHTAGPGLPAGASLRHNRTSPLFNFTRDMLSAAAQASVQLATYWAWEDDHQLQTYGIFPPNATAQNDEHTIEVLRTAAT